MRAWGKRDKELKYAIEQNDPAINCESRSRNWNPADAFSAEAGKADHIASINSRHRPKTNHCIDTLRRDSKFGTSMKRSEHGQTLLLLKNNIDTVFISRFVRRSGEPHVFETCNKVNAIVENPRNRGCKIPKFVDVGGVWASVCFDVRERSRFTAVLDRPTQITFVRMATARCTEFAVRFRCSLNVKATIA